MLTQKTRTNLTLIVCACAIWFISKTNYKPTPKQPLDTKTIGEMAGTWTDPKGPKGNHISFEWKKIKDDPWDPLALISAVYDTKGEIDNLFGFQKVPFTFGFFSHAPDAVPFLNLGGRNQLLLKLKARDHNHMSAQVLSRDFDKQEEELASPPTEPPLELVREKEPVFRPNY